jgi:hypothetical protein
LYVLWSYISSKSVDNIQFKLEARKIFRRYLISFIEDNYDFLKVTTDADVKDFIITNFYWLNGRIYRPSNSKESNSFIVAMKGGNSIQKYLEENTTGNFQLDEYHLK